MGESVKWVGNHHVGVLSSAAGANNSGGIYCVMKFISRDQFHIAAWYLWLVRAGRSLCVNK